MLAIVLVVLVVMMLGGVSLLSSVDTSAMLSGNIGFKRDSVNGTGFVLNKAFEKMKSANFTGKQDSIVGCPPPASNGSRCTDASVWTGLNFYPRLLESDENGIPVILKTTSAFDRVFTAGTVLVQDSRLATMSEGRYLIERMCNAYGPSSKITCMLSTNSPKGGGWWAGKPGSTASPLYRITVRTDGIRNSQTYAQWVVTFTQE